MRKRKIGSRAFGSVVNVTDPCYDDDVWGRRDVNVKPGEYVGYVWKSWQTLPDEAGKTRRVARNGCIGIYLNGEIPNVKTRIEIGEVGVDSGMCGFFENKPNYTDDEWSLFVKKIASHDEWQCNDGFVSASGEGDGLYPVYGYKNADGEFVALEVYF